MSLLVVDGLTAKTSAREPVTIVDSVSFRLGAGARMGVAGESGCGKTVLARSLVRLLPDGWRLEGVLRFRGEDLLALAEKDMRRLRGRHIALVCQDPATGLNPALTIGNQLREVLRLRGAAGDRTEERLYDLLDRVQLSGVSPQTYPHELSHGMRQRVMLAMGLAGEPDILIADEPTSSLDVTVQAHIVSVILKAQEQLGFGLIFVSHDLALLGLVTDQLMVVYAGRIVESGPTAKLLDRPRHPYTRALLDCSLTLDGGAKPLRGTPASFSGLPSGCAFHPRCDRMVDACGREAPALVELARDHRAACIAAGGRDG